MSKTLSQETEFKPYQINTEALLGEVLAKHPFGVFGAIKEHIDNAIDANSTEVDITFDAKTRKIYIGNKSEKCYREADVEQLFHRRHHGRISQNDYGRTIILGFSDPQIITIETYISDGKKVIDTYELSPKGWKLAIVEVVKQAPEFTTIVSATLRKDVDFNISEFAMFVNTVYNLHLFRKTVKITINGKPIQTVLPEGEPKTKDFEFGNHKFKSFMWQKPQWKQGKIYQSMTTKGVGDGAFITSKNTLVTYAPFYRSHMGEEQSYFVLINDEEGYFAEDSLDLGKLQLMFIPKVSRFYRYIKDNILPKEKTKPSDVITEGNQYLKDFFAVGIGSYEHKPSETTEEKPEDKGGKEVEKSEEEKKAEEKNPNISSEHRNAGLPELTIRTMKDFDMVPFVDIVNPKLLALNDADPLFEKSWMKGEMRETYLIRLVPFLDARRAYKPEEVADARKQWLIQDQFVRKLLHAKPKKGELEEGKQAKKQKVTEAIIAPTVDYEKESDKLYDELFNLDQNRKNKVIKDEEYLSKSEEVRSKLRELQQKYKASVPVQTVSAPIAKTIAPKSAGRPRKPETPKDEQKKIEENRAEVDAKISKMKPIKTWNLPTRMDKSTGKQKIIVMALYKVDGKNVRRPLSVKEVSGEDVVKNLTKPSKQKEAPMVAS